jgi:hypothetical protein
MRGITTSRDSVVARFERDFPNSFSSVVHNGNSAWLTIDLKYCGTLELLAQPLERRTGWVQYIPSSISIAIISEKSILLGFRAGRCLSKWAHCLRTPWSYLSLIPESALPTGTLVFYREPTLWERGRKYLLAEIAVIVLQTLLIFGLFWQRARRTSAASL